MRTETNKLVTDLVDFDRVQSLLLMILYRRRYIAQREQARIRLMGGPGEWLRCLCSLSNMKAYDAQITKKSLPSSSTISPLRRRQ